MPVRDDAAARSRSRPASTTGASWAGWPSTSIGHDRCGCCISRRDDRRSGWPPSGSSRAGNASRNPEHPASEVAHGRVHAAHRGQGAVRVVALAGELVAAAHVAVRQALGRDSSSSEPDDVMPSGTSSRSRTKSRYSTPAAAVTTRPRIPYPRFE